LPARSSHLLGDSRVSLVSSAVLLRIEFTAMDTFARHRVRSYRTFPSLPGQARRYLSVALFLKLPSAGVTRYPYPVEPGLSSWTAFRRCPRDCPARSLHYC